MPDVLSQLGVVAGQLVRLAVLIRESETTVGAAKTTGNSFLTGSCRVLPGIHGISSPAGGGTALRGVLRHSPTQTEQQNGNE